MATAASSAPPPTKIFVGRLPENANVDELRSIFERYGTVTECDILNKYGFVHMKTEDMAREAIANLNNSEFMGSRITVEQSTGQKSARKMRGGFMGGMRGRGRGMMMRPYGREMGMRRPFGMEGRPPPPPMPGGPGMRNGFYDGYGRERYDDYYDRRPPPSMPYREPERRPYMDSYDRYPPMERERRPLPPPYPSPYERREYPSRMGSLDMYRRRTPPMGFDDRNSFDYEPPSRSYGRPRMMPPGGGF